MRIIDNTFPGVSENEQPAFSTTGLFSERWRTSFHEVPSERPVDQCALLYEQLCLPLSMWQLGKLSPSSKGLAKCEEQTHGFPWTESFSWITFIYCSCIEFAGQAGIRDKSNHENVIITCSFKKTLCYRV